MTRKMSKRFLRAGDVQVEGLGYKRSKHCTMVDFGALKSKFDLLLRAKLKSCIGLEARLSVIRKHIQADVQD